MAEAKNVTPEPNSAEVYEFEDEGGGPRYYLVYEPNGGVAIDRQSSRKAAHLSAANWETNGQNFRSSFVGKDLPRLVGLARKIAPIEEQQRERWELTWSERGYIRTNLPQHAPLISRPKIR